MSPEIQKALVIATAKLGIGSMLIGAIIGIRVITATPEGIEGDIEAMQADHAARLDEDAGRAAQASAATPPSEPRAATATRKAARRPAREKASTDGDRLVRCVLGQGTQFMRADDCGMRGGEAVDVEPEDS